MKWFWVAPHVVGAALGAASAWLQPDVVDADVGDFLVDAVVAASVAAAASWMALAFED
jgi:hypothetical protein